MQDFSLPQQRREHILTLLENGPRVVATELCQVFGVSEDTVRRDLNALASQGLLRRVHGGALSAPSSFRQRASAPEGVKQRLAQAAIAHIHAGQTLYLDSGTHVAALAAQLPQEMALTVVTPSPPVMMALSEHTQVQVIVLGGTLHGANQSVVGSMAMTMLGQIRLDMAFIGLCGLEAEAGLTASTFEEAALKQLAMKQATQSLALVQHRIIGEVGAFTIAPAAMLDVLITDCQDDAALAAFRDAGTRCEQVSL